MKKLVKTSVLIVVLALMLTSLAGCGNQSKEGTTAPAVTTTSAAGGSTASADKYAQYRPIEGKKYEFTKACWVPGPVDNENGDLIKFYDEKFNAKIINLNLDASKYMDILNLSMASGDVPDMFQVWGFSAFSKFVDGQMVMTFDEELLQALAPNIYKIYTEEAPGGFDYAKDDNGKIAGVAGVRFHNSYYYPMVWRSDWLKNVGITKVPETMAELETALYKFTKEDPDKNGKSDTYGLSDRGVAHIKTLFGAAPTDIASTNSTAVSQGWVERDGKLVYSDIQPEMKECLALLSKWYKDGIIDPEFITGENQGGHFALSHAFLNNKVGLTGNIEYFYWSPVQPEGLMVSEFKKANPDAPTDAIHVAKPPVGPQGKSYAPKLQKVLTNIWAFSKDFEKEPDRFGKLMEVFDYTLSSYDNYLTAWFGPENVSWKMENGIPTPIDKYTDNVEKNKIGAYAHMDFLQPKVYWGPMYKDRTDWAEQMGFSEDIGIRSELYSALPSAGKYMTELIKIQTEAYVKIITGEEPVSYFDAYVKKWQDAGGSKIEQEANEWYSKIKQ